MNRTPKIFILIAVSFCLSCSHINAVKVSDRKSDIDHFLLEEMQKQDIPGLSFAIVRSNQIFYANAIGEKNIDTKEPVRSNTLFEAASISKLVFSYYVMKLVDAGILDLDRPLIDYANVNWISDLRVNDITARMVLTHSSGFPNWRFHNEDGLLDIKFTPGSEFLYSGEGFEYLAEVLSRHVGNGYDDLEKDFQKRVASPLALKNTTFSQNSNVLAQKAFGHENGKVIQDKTIGFDSYFGAAYGLHTTAEDLALLLIAISTRDGLSKASHSVMLNKQISIPDDDDLRTLYNFDAWGLGVILGSTEYGKKIAHGGINPSFQGYAVMIPNREFGFVFLGNNDSAIKMIKQVENYLYSKFLED